MSQPIQVSKQILDRLRQEIGEADKSMFVNSFGMPTIYGIRVEQRPGIFRRLWDWIKSLVALRR